MLKSLLTVIGKQNIINAKWSSSKAQLLKLRKNTGYPFDSCKKALQLNNNDLEKVIIINLLVELDIIYILIFFLIV